MKTEDINPDLLRWARQTAGLTIDQAASKLGLKDTRKATAIEKLAAVEAGTRPIGETFLRTAAATYNRPLVAFYLPKPPEQGERGADFRTSANRADTRGEALLDALVRDVRARQQMLKELLIDLDEMRPLTFVASAELAIGAEEMARRIRDVIGISVEDQIRAKDAESLFKMLRYSCGAIGVYVLLLGDLGSHHSDLGEQIFRGLAIADNLAPLVVINDNDAPTARSFTLIHELAHLWIGASGISGPLENVPVADVERFCNAVASEFLLPENSLSGFDVAAGDAIQAAVLQADRIADKWNISPAAVVYRAAMLGVIRSETASAAFAVLAARWRSKRAKDRAVRDTEEGGPSYYVTRRHKLGSALLDLVRRGLQDDAVTHVKAAQILGVSPASVNALLRDRPNAA